MDAKTPAAKKDAPFKALLAAESREGGKITDSKKNMPEFSITARNLKKSYREGPKELEVLKGLDLQIQTGEIAAIVGPSGAGKSTLLHVIGLMDQISSGELNVLGFDTARVQEQERDALRNKYIGFMFQFHHLLPELTVLENAALPLRIQGRDKAYAEEKAAELLASIGLQDRGSHFPSEISGGEQQRTALARALIHHPSILLCDEPTGNLDLERGEEIRDLIWRTARARHTTVLIATHNPDIAQKADRIVRIADGKIFSEPQGRKNT